MLSYKQWKFVNESISAVGPITLGFGRPNVLGIVGAQDAELDLEESKKKMKKKMFGDGGDEKISIKDKPSDDEELEVSADSDSDEDMDDEDADVDDSDDMDDDDTDDDDSPCEGGMKKCGKKMKKKSKKGMKKKMSEMTQEEITWLKELAAQMPAVGQRHGSGLQEDQLLAPTDPNAELEAPYAQQVQPGEPGFAPQGRVGW